MTEWHTLSDELRILENSDPVVKAAADRLDETIWRLNWRASMQKEIDEARRLARERVQNARSDPDAVGLSHLQGIST